MAMIAFPLVNRKLLDWRDVLNAGIIDEHIQATECFLRERDHLLDLLRLAHVRGRIDSLHAEIFSIADRSFSASAAVSMPFSTMLAPAPAKERAHARPYAAPSSRSQPPSCLKNTHFILLVVPYREP